MTMKSTPAAVPGGPAMGAPLPPGGPRPGGKLGGAAGMPVAGAMPAAGKLGASVPPKVAWSYVKRSLPLLRPMRGYVAASMILGLIVTALPFVVPAVWGPIVAIMGQAAGPGGTNPLSGVWGMDAALITRQDHSTAGPTLSFAGWLTVWGAAMVLSQVLGFLRVWVEAQVDWKLMTEIRQRAHDHLQSLSLDFFTGARSGALMQRVQTEALSVQKLVTDCLMPPLIDALVLIGALAYMLAMSWQMTLASLILFPLVLIILRFTGKKTQATTLRWQLSSRHLGGELEETITGITDIQIFNAHKRRSDRFRSASSEAAKNTAFMPLWLQISSRSTQIFVAFSTALVVIVGVAFSTSFGLTFPSLVVLVGFLPTMFAPVQRIIEAFNTYSSTIPSVASTYELLDTKPSIADNPDALSLDEIHGNIVFKDVVFGYNERQKILDGVSFSIKEGETIALVGHIGSGKSTIFNLLLRFLDPQEGRIELDGHDIKTLSLSELREQVSKLSQFPFFLKDSIRENVRLARTEASDDDVEEACKLAHIHSVIVDPDRIELGYETVVDVQVPSGGQKRLIAMARCLLRKPEVLLLDEPTENLDADQRARLTQVIREYALDRTCIVVSHDMDFIAAVSDRIIVLDKGKVAEQGTHRQLLANDGLYKQLYLAQNAEPASSSTE